MNPTKSAIKLDLLHEQGVVFDDMLEGKERLVHELAGSIHAIRQAKERVVPAVLAAVNLDFDEGKLDTLSSPLEISGYIKQQVARVQNGLDNMLMNLERERIVSEGRVAQLKEVVAHTKKVRDTELVALKEFKASVEAGEAEPDGRPGLSAADDIAQRRATAQAAKAAEAHPPTKGKKRKGAGGASDA